MLFLLISLLMPSAPLTGRASIVDGDTLEIHGQRIRLWGVDAPESRQTCMRDGAAYRCGTEAASALAAWIGTAPIACTPVGRPDRYRRVVARCDRNIASLDRGGPSAGRVSPTSLNGWLVRHGWAVDYPTYSRGAYASLQDAARTRREGIWAGSFEMPWDWRARRRGGD